MDRLSCTVIEKKLQMKMINDGYTKNMAVMIKVRCENEYIDYVITFRFCLCSQNMLFPQTQECLFFNTFFQHNNNTYDYNIKSNNVLFFYEIAVKVPVLFTLLFMHYT